MARVTLKKVNQMAAKYDCSFHKGNGFFTFTHNAKDQTLRDGMVCTFHLNNHTLEEWEEMLKYAIADSKYHGNMKR